MKKLPIIFLQKTGEVMSIYCDPKNRSTSTSASTSTFIPISTQPLLHPLASNSIYINDSSLTSMEENSSTPSKLSFENIKITLQKFKRISLEFLGNLQAEFLFLLKPSAGLASFSAALIAKTKSKEEILQQFQSLTFGEKEAIKNSIWQRKGSDPHVGITFGEDMIKNDPFHPDVLLATVDASTELKGDLLSLQNFKKILFSYSSTQKDVKDAYKVMSIKSRQLILENLTKNQTKVANEKDLEIGQKTFDDNPKGSRVKVALIHTIQILEAS